MTPKDASTPDSGLWKDWVNRDRIEKMADVFAKVSRSGSKFKREAFVAAVCTDEFDRLELKDRIVCIARKLHDFLPTQYDRAVKLLVKVAPDVGGFENWALTAYVEQFGVEHFDDSVWAMRELTQHGSAEFAIRPFMLRYLDRMMPILHEWAQDDNEHVRRLAAEGCRPRGVWTAHIPALKKNPRPALELLDRLKADESLYVRKAVANNLNDISKDNPDLAVATARKWLKKGKGTPHKHTVWIVKHACRTLIKQGRPDVFPLFGFTENPQFTVSKFGLVAKRVKVGDESEVALTLKSIADKRQKLAIDYAVYYMKKNGELKPKVFKLAEKTVKPGETLDLSTKHSFREMTTRKHYPGKHEIELIVNGLPLNRAAFTLAR